MRSLMFIIILSLSLASIAQSRADEVIKTKKTKTKVMATKKSEHKNPEDCETKEEVLKKISAKEVKPEAMQAKPTTDGLGLKGVSTGCSL